MAQEPLVGQAFPLSRIHDYVQLDTPNSVGRLWTNDQPYTETSAWHLTTLKKENIHAFGGMRTHNLSKRAVADQRLCPRGHWDWSELV